MSGSRLKKPFDVLIQGAGPVGCVAALLANQRGLSVCMIDAQSENAYRGNAHYLNAYTLEILDLAGIDLTNLFTMKTTGDYAYAMAIGTNLQNIVCYKNLYEDHQIRDRYLHTGRYQGSANIRMSILSYLFYVLSDNLLYTLVFTIFILISVNIS